MRMDTIWYGKAILKFHFLLFRFFFEIQHEGFSSEVKTILILYQILFNEISFYTIAESTPLHLRTVLKVDTIENGMANLFVITLKIIQYEYFNVSWLDLN